MRSHKVLYFSVNTYHIDLFVRWAQLTDGHPELVRWSPDEGEPLRVDFLPTLVGRQDDIDSLHVIIDYRALLKGSSSDDREHAVKVLRYTILQYPEADFLFDQTGLPEGMACGLEFLLGPPLDGEEARHVLHQYHVFRADGGCPFFFAKLDYDNIFDGSRLRWAVRRMYYKRLQVSRKNFEKVQDQRRDNLAVVVDDEPRQGRFNAFALYAAGYSVMCVNNARMLLSLEGQNLDPKLVIRDFDLQFPDVQEKKDYEASADKYIFKCVPVWNAEKGEWKEKSIEIARNLFNVSGKAQAEGGGKKTDSQQVSTGDKMIDYIRGYRYEESLPRWWIVGGTWRGFDVNKCYIVTNGHADLDVRQGRRFQRSTVKGAPQKEDDAPIVDSWMEVEGTLRWSGMLKPISGLYHPFFTMIKDAKGKRIVERCFRGTRVVVGDEGYKIDKHRQDHHHGVPLDIYDVVSEMLKRAERYYDEGRFIKACVLSEEVMEFLNGFHHQLMIQAYHLKSVAENAIAMDVVGADEDRLRLDALLRISIIRQDVHRMVVSQEADAQGFRADRKERLLLGHIFNECREVCRQSGYLDVEAVFISAMAHSDHSAYAFGKWVWKWLKNTFIRNKCTKNTHDEQQEKRTK